LYHFYLLIVEKPRCSVRGFSVFMGWNNLKKMVFIFFLMVTVIWPLDLVGRKGNSFRPFLSKNLQHEQPVLRLIQPEQPSLHEISWLWKIWQPLIGLRKTILRELLCSCLYKMQCIRSWFFLSLWIIKKNLKKIKNFWRMQIFFWETFWRWDILFEKWLWKSEKILSIGYLGAWPKTRFRTVYIKVRSIAIKKPTTKCFGCGLYG